MEFEKLFAVANQYMYNLGEITEYTVVKETPKTYIVEKTSDITNPRGGWHNQNIVKKADMEVYDKHFCKSYAEALEYKMIMLETRIENNKKNIAEMTAKNAEYRAVINQTNIELQKLYEGVK